MKKCKENGAEPQKSLYSSWTVLNQLYDKLNSMLCEIKKTSLLEVASKTEMYGCLRCIRMIVESTQDFLSVNGCQEYFQKLVELSFELDRVTFPILGSPSPEGFLPG